MTDQRRNDLLVILLDALERFYTYVSSYDPQGRAIFQETSRWFADTDASDPRSFEYVCGRLGLEPGRIRESLVKRRAEITGEVLRVKCNKR